MTKAPLSAVSLKITIHLPIRTSCHVRKWSNAWLRATTPSSPQG